MWKEAVAETGIIFYLMLGVGIVGILAKVMNYVTLRKLVNAAGSMSKSTHKLMKLVRAKYEHACMIHDKVENVGAFVEKYIYEYRGFIFRVHTWRQVELQAIWFSGILALLGAGGHYLAHGFCEGMFQYLAAGAAEMMALFVIRQLSDEPYKMNAAKIYIVDYLENVCAHRYKKVKQTEKENIDVISPENAGAARTVTQREEQELSINIEGEPRRVEKGEAARQVIRRTVKEKLEEDEQPALKEEAIRQILEEFLA